jgi:ribosome biogenesis GTPase A
MSLNEQVKTTVESAIEFLDELGNNNDSVQLKKTLTDALNESNVKVLLYGLYNAGKSTIINALVGRKVAEENASPTNHTIEEHSYMEGITLVDSPGLDSAYFKQHEPIANEALLKSDLVIYCISSKGSFEEKKVWMTLVSICDDMNKPIGIVLNDKGDEGLDNILETVKQKRDAFLKESVPIFTFNARKTKQLRLAKTDEKQIGGDFENLKNFIVNKVDFEKQHLKLRTPVTAALEAIKENMPSNSVAKLEKRKEQQHREIEEKKKELRDIKDRAEKNFQSKLKELNSAIPLFAKDIFLHIEIQGSGLDTIMENIEKDINTELYIKSENLNSALSSYISSMKSIVEKLPVVNRIKLGAGISLDGLKDMDFGLLEKDLKGFLKQSVVTVKSVSGLIDSVIKKASERGVITIIEESGEEALKKGGNQIIKVGSKEISKKTVQSLSTAIGVVLAGAIILWDLHKTSKKKKAVKGKIANEFEKLALQISGPLSIACQDEITEKFNICIKLLEAQNKLNQKETEAEISKAKKAKKLIKNLKKLF